MFLNVFGNNFTLLEASVLHTCSRCFFLLYVPNLEAPEGEALDPEGEGEAPDRHPEGEAPDPERVIEAPDRHLEGEAPYLESEGSGSGG